jgi:surfeit locus 1 family protein
MRQHRIRNPFVTGVYQSGVRTRVRSGPPLAITPRGVVASLLLFAAAAACVRLGFWQLERRTQRHERNADLAARLDASPAPLIAPVTDTTGWLYRRVTLSGRFDADRTIILPGRSWHGAPGAHVVTPLLLEGGGAVLVDRGWVGAADGATVDLETVEPDGPVAATGLILPFPGRGSRFASTGPDTAASGFRRVWFALNEPALRRQFPYPLGEIQVQLLPGDSARATIPLRLPAPALDAGPHLGYAIQWFSFAVVALVGWMAMIMKSGVARADAASQ